MTDNTELKRLAEAATAGPWSMCGEADGSQGFEIIQDIWNEHGTHTGKDVVVYEWSDESDPLGVIHRADAEFIAAANPVAVLALIADSNRLESEAVYAAAGFNAAREEIAKIHAEVAGLRTGYEAYEQVNAELKAEVEALRQIISDSATSCGAAVSVECTLDFMKHLPVEIFSVISKLRNALAECADSLHGEMLQKFGGQLPDDMHPVTRREYDRDMAEVVGCRAALGQGEQS